MSLHILIAMNDKSTGAELQKDLASYGYESEVVANGRDCQIRISKSKVFAVLLDLEIENYSAVEVLKFLKFSHPSVKILLMVKNKESFAKSILANKPLLKLGISEVIYGPFVSAKIKDKLVSIHGVAAWKNIKVSDDRGEPKRILDSEVSPINVEEFYSDNISLFDHYIKLASNKYKKIINRGEIFSPDRIKKYGDDGVKCFYILTSDRMHYINYVNTSIKETLTKTNGDTSTNLLLPLKNITIKYMEEVHTEGLNQQLVEEGKAICQNMYELIQKDRNLHDSLSKLHELEPTMLTHSFLVSFFSVYICKQLVWAGRRTVDTIAMGALLHDIGLLSLPGSLRNMKVSEMTPANITIYQQHPKLGVDLIHKSNLATESLLQIIYQHHEYLDGTGFPNQISGTKIFPLAKIVSLADAFSDAMIEHKTSPKETIRIFLRERDNLLKFDPLLLKSLVHGIVS